MINSTVHLLTCCSLGPEQIMLGVKAGDINTYSWKRLVIIKKKKNRNRCYILGGLSSSHYGEGNGNLLQYSCLENPMNGGAG